jgi:hypothetical protein
MKPTTKHEIKYCTEWQDIIEGKKPGVIVYYEDIVNRSEVYLDSIKLSKNEFERKYSLYYQLNPEQ